METPKFRFRRFIHMNETGLLGLFCGAASLSGMMLSTSFFLNNKQKNLVNVFLGSLFLAVSLRIAKSIWFFIFYDVATWGVFSGFIALGMIGPSLLLYLKQSHNRVLKKIDFIHLLPVVLGIGVKIFYPGITFRQLYISMTIVLGAYIGFSVFQHLRYAYDSANLKRFNSLMVFSTAIITLAFASQHVTGTLLNYAYGAAAASLVIYYLTIQNMTRSLSFNDMIKKKTVIPGKVILDVKRAFEKEEIFLRSGITLTQFSKEKDIPAYLITKSVNQIYGRSFPETVNHFRINKVKNDLTNRKSELYKIEGLAYDAGFSTPSSFYAAFKKETGMTPTSFQKQYIQPEPKVA